VKKNVPIKALYEELEIRLITMNRHRTVRSHRNEGAKYKTTGNGSSEVVLINMLQKIGFITFSV